MINQSISLVLFLCSGFLLFGGSAEAASTDQAFVDGLIRQAEHKKLYEDRYWHILLHYKKTLAGTESLIDDPHFFLAKDGKHNPQAELEATLRAFFSDSADTDNPPLCRFIARFTWLKEQLGFDESRLPIAACQKFNKTMAVIKPQSASLIFPAAYMNNPASMFGHTLINIETSSKSKLLSHAVNYSAFTTEKNGLVFALKGLSGFYKGYYSILPYYEKVQEYRDINQRDIWEYQLNLKEQEVNKMVMHIWELQGIYSYYYFFDENCSYNILFLLEAARPSLHLTDQFGWWVIPTDTIKLLLRSGVIAGCDYRPSKATKIKYLASLLDPQQQDAAIGLSTGLIKPDAVVNQTISERDKIRTLDLGVEYLQYSYVKKEIPRDRYTALFLALLTARSSYRTADAAGDEPSVPPQPEKGHDPIRLGFGAGMKQGRWFEELRFRVAYHGLLDNEAGYARGSQIQFLNTALRYYNVRKKFELKYLDVVDIISLSPRDRFFKPFSWKVRTGFSQQLLKDGDDHLVYRLNTGGGFAYTNTLLGLYYGMIEADLHLSGSYRENYTLGIGASAGFKKNLTDQWIMLINARSLYYGLGDEHKTYQISMKHSYVINTQRSFSWEITRTRTFGIYETDAVFMWNVYF